MKFVKLQHLRYFVAAFEARSITAAASRVNATQSGVSMHIRDLEAILGLTMFERTPTGVSPTKAGDQIYLRANRVLLEVDELRGDIESHTDELYGCVRAGIMPTFARSVLAPALIRFTEQNPYVDVKITKGYSERLTAEVAAGELDFAVVPNGNLPVGVRSTLVDSDVEVLVQGNRSATKEGAPVHLASAPSLNLILPGPGNARRPNIDRYLSNMCKSTHSIMELDSMMTTFDMLARGEYASVLPGCLCLSSIQDPDMKLSPVVDPPLTFDYLLIEPSTKATTTVVQAFVDGLCDDIKRNCQAGRDRFLR